MNGSKLHQATLELLDHAGIRINGDRPWDMRLLRPGVPERAFAQGNLGLGDAYVDGDWEAERLDEFFDRLLRTRMTGQIQPLRLLGQVFAAKFLNLQNVARARRVGEVHYDLGNDFYGAMLDPRMTYTCGYWETASTLEQAQEAKLDLICRKLRLQPGMRVLDIGCGWGSFMAFAAERYGVQAVGVSISKEQVAWARQRYAGLPLEFRLQDYRAIDGQFDAIVSIGMFEHVGRKNHRTYMELVHRCLKPGGLFLLHTIGKNQRRSTPDPWIGKYIFPNGDLPSAGQIGDAVDDLFVVEDVHNFGADYDKTLMAWHDNFIQAWPRFAAQLGPRFYRMWRYYLLSCAGAFRARDIQLWQWVLSRDSLGDGYRRETI
ncbi:cyclopropane fatty acyl phospholipid synthase [Janthinobacterium agaricidamnosum]|uniref:Cyclopropane-fatty-acyl-phospholipid synthase n=1 Tax=Janthinobacterium agaricidamnosum NBRC 102515 = DSM 9628 TaxID=1349767 RepID=W0V0N5_9BURK|nr:cyclopropane fatty acyl phospholipid synthase [Janthinobacterium agaricidamnosum]CDG80852.1 cyclopropane-fatty-acyl-phospholipid synthase [Janthinobacterium agaricidamnosum NBRC 102515 = DSM 9628]